MPEVRGLGADVDVIPGNPDMLVIWVMEVLAGVDMWSGEVDSFGGNVGLEPAAAAAQLIYFFWGTKEQTFLIVWGYPKNIFVRSALGNFYKSNLSSPLSWVSDPPYQDHDFDGVRPTILDGWYCRPAYVSRDF